MTAAGKVVLPLLVASVCVAQPQFEVASIRPAGELSDSPTNLGFHIDGAQLHVNSLTLRDCIAIAYRLKISQVFGPEWIASVRWNIAATIPEGMAGKEREMLQTLLDERFRIKSHREKRDFPVYALLIGKPPLKLKESPIDSSDADLKGSTTLAGGGSAAGIGINLGHGASYSFVPNHFEAKKLTMAQFAINIERFADRPVIDMTGLTSTYDFSFEVNPEDYQPLLIRAAVAAGVSLPPQALRLLDSSSPAVLIDAIAPTGLRLDARKAPLDVIVVDDALKTPIEN